MGEHGWFEKGAVLAVIPRRNRYTATIVVFQRLMIGRRCYTLAAIRYAVTSAILAIPGLRVGLVRDIGHHHIDPLFTQNIRLLQPQGAFFCCLRQIDLRGAATSLLRCSLRWIRQFVLVLQKLYGLRRNLIQVLTGRSADVLDASPRFTSYG